DDRDRVAAPLGTVAERVATAGLDADADAAAIAAMLDATDTLADAAEAGQVWSDLATREKLAAHGFYDVFDHRKDFPPEWNAVKVFEKGGRADKLLVALDELGSEFMEENTLAALKRLGPEVAVEEMHARAQKREKAAVEILGTIGSEEPVETLIEYVDADSDRPLQKVTFRALGEIGAAEAVQPIANKLVADHETTRSRAARALGMIGDTRAIQPLAERLEVDESDRVRASAAWALNAIGTERALSIVRTYRDDRAYLVQAEAERAG
ncbi:hypothetical protein BRD17_01265, partial [Halobacteriales archaeon SW_7_68_16]